MPRKYGYVDPLLSNLAVDYALTARKGLIGPIIFPRVFVPKPSGKYAKYDKETAYKVPDTTMAGERSQAKEWFASGKEESYATTSHGLKRFIAEDDLRFMEGPFKTWELRSVHSLVSMLELSQEKRIADKVKALQGRSTTLDGVGDKSGNKWAGGKGDPIEAIKAAIAKCFVRPNVMVLPEDVYNVLEYHPAILTKLGEANLIKKVDENNLSKLFRIPQVIITEAKADFEKRNADGTVNIESIWGDAVILAHTSKEWDAPCCGKTLCLQYAEADGQGYVVRTWDEEDGGVLGGEYVQVAHSTDELVVCNDLIYTIKGVI